MDQATTVDVLDSDSASELSFASTDAAWPPKLQPLVSPLLKFNCFNSCIVFSLLLRYSEKLMFACYPVKSKDNP